MCEQGKFPLHLRPSLGQMGRQFHAGAVKPEPGFCGSGFGFFQSVRCPIRWTKVTDALGTRLRPTEFTYARVVRRGLRYGLTSLFENTRKSNCLRMFDKGSAFSSFI